MTEPKKFNFDTEFRREGDLVSNAARLRQRKVLSQEELDAMFARARAEGMKAGQVRAAEATAAAVAQLADTVQDSMKVAQSQIEALREEAAQLALIVARKLAHVAVENMPEGEVMEALHEAIHQAITEPRIVLKAAPNVIALIKDQLETVAHELGYEGRLIATPEQGMRGADCRIEWRGGGAERKMDHLEQAIGEVITRRFSQSRTTRKG
jgi:flagellar assembly protein FliH